MERIAVIGAQWGDEGKGKVVDFLAKDMDVVARYSGGPNAGHTVIIGDKQYILHLIPSGILHRSCKNVMGNGMVVDPEALLTEIEDLEKAGVYIGDNLLISEAAHVIMPYHKKLDALNEKVRGKKQIGTTLRGIGPAYADKASRIGIRICELLHPEVLREKIEFNLNIKNTIIENFFGEKGFDADELYEKALGWAERIRGFVGNSVSFIKKAIKERKSILYEGAQGTMLDIDHGTYPYVTSSNPTIGGILTGLGIPKEGVEKIVGIVKAYTTRVGGGPFPTEDTGDVGNMLRDKGHEYGATTGRPRRCGWLDLVALKYAAWVNGLSHIAITKLDVLDGFGTIKVCIAYNIDGEITEEFPADPVLFSKAKPIYKELPGWSGSVRGISDVDKFPKEALQYVEFIAEQMETQILMVSTGPERSETVMFGK
ncbi:adenylosuccinate synthase [Thermosulfidibacter takaii ABI70S6]|uniref:Adenylosuccinate synthetase n=1 Tax=Thermosulfidibacter takaii (strain DSM 17441 / JCM 13301 / NBRC 103674 / ABI70S6) TaxID=1298851 RepID=A0A0S3QTH5_THET7|nr:adenylosuccinate synthase [Thermosulfidibacter takaii]BAT71641.1 adenylosuccinate synthase [Thermosulfidibacter takaii ABI70S6]